MTSEIEDSIKKESIALYNKYVNENEFFKNPSFINFKNFLNTFKETYKQYNKKAIGGISQCIEDNKDWKFYTVLCCLFNFPIHKSDYVYISQCFDKDELEKIKKEFNIIIK